tara:strand:- start:252 stop:596 length:345 start_codon:yes stop_codon:yes gene_type:complete
MNLREQIEKEITEKVMVKLASEKIELGLIDDVKKEMGEANKGAMKAIDLAESAKTPAEKSLKLNKSLLEKIAKTKKAAIELGVTDVVKQMQTQEKQVKENISSIDKLLNALYKI